MNQETEEAYCPHCLSDDGAEVYTSECYKHCHTVENGEHDPDPYTIYIDPDLLKELVSTTPDHLIFDINCQMCGTSGSFSVEINPNNIQWE